MEADCLFCVGFWGFGMRRVAFSNLATQATYWLSNHLPTLLYSATASP